MSSAILTISELKKHFVVGHNGTFNRSPITVRAIDGVSFDLQKGETLGLVGESGSGKSTIAYILAGMYQPTFGKITFQGADLMDKHGHRPLSLKKEIQIVFQDAGSSLNPRRTIAQILATPLRIHKPGKDIMRETLRLLELVDLPATYMYKYPNMLSGGEKQIVAIARALASDPSFIILDEPTSALDVSEQGKVINLLIRLQAELGLTYLFITHDLSLMRNIASRVAIMYLGKLCEIAKGEEFFQAPEHPYTQMLLSSIPVVSEEEEKLKPEKMVPTGEIPSPVNIPHGCSFNTRCPKKMDICFQVDPEMVSIGDQHLVRCHLFDKP